MYKPSQKIYLEFKKRKLEDPESLKIIESWLKKQKGEIVQKPKKNDNVILLVSGGLDSTIIWLYLLEELNVNVYPLFLRRGQKRVKYEERAVNFFSNYFKRKYPQYWHPVKKMNAYIPPMEIRFPITLESNKPINKKGQWRGIPVYSGMLFSYAVQYSYYLEITKQVLSRTIFTSFMPMDGQAIRDETLTAVRSINMNVILLTGDQRWQTIALPLEREWGFFTGKSEFIKWAGSQDLPLDRTRSCIMWHRNHCGKCISCVPRKIAFKDAGVIDKTRYGIFLPSLRKLSYSLQKLVDTSFR